MSDLVLLFLSFSLSPAWIMSSTLQKLITPLAEGPAEPPRNKVTVVGVGMVGMACAVSILLRVSRTQQNTTHIKRTERKQ